MHKKCDCKYKYSLGWAPWLILVILAIWEAEIRRVTVGGQPKKKFMSSWLGVVPYTCHPSYGGSVNRRTKVQAGSSLKKARPCSKNT
jgi:hypothetical protein